MKESLTGHRCGNDKEVKSAVNKWLKNQSTQFFRDSKHALVKWWAMAIETGDQ